MNSTNFLTPYLIFNGDPHIQSLFPNRRLVVSSIATTIIVLALGFITYQRASRKGHSATIPMIKSSLPWIGSALDFARAPANFLQECRKRHGTVYKIHVAGRTIMITSSPKSILNIVHNKSKDFQIVDYLNMHLISGLEDAQMPKLWPTILEIFSLSHTLFSPNRSGPLMSAYNNAVVQHFQRLVCSDDPETYTLDEFVFRTNFFAIFEMLMGPKFDFQAKTYNSWRAYEDGVHNIIRRLPFFARSATQGREQLLQTVQEHIRQHWVDNSDGGYLNEASETISVVTQKLKHINATDEETARVVNYLLWGTTGTIARLINWVMRYMIVYPDVYSAIREEIQQVVTAKYPEFSHLPEIDARTLTTDFPILSSTLNEIIRIMTQSVVLRQASVDTFLTDENGSQIPVSKGDYVLADTQGYHHSETHFPDADIFKPDRSQGRTANRSLAFSAGPHVCSGAFLAKATARMFVILCLQMYDVEIKFEKGVVSALEILPNSFLQLPLPKYQAEIVLTRRSS